MLLLLHFDTSGKFQIKFVLAAKQVRICLGSLANLSFYIACHINLKFSDSVHVLYTDLTA